MSTRTVTLLFCDLVGSTALLTRLGDEKGNEVRRDHVAALREALARHGGTEVKSLGDGLMVAFLSAADAVSAAVAMQRSIARMARRDATMSLALRVGVSIGESTQEDDDWFGTPVVEAARLCAVAESGQILVNELVLAVMRALRTPGYEPHGPMALKGLADPVSVWSVSWELDAGYRPPLPDQLDTAKRFVFVGRTAETATMAQAWRRALEGRGDLVLVAGEPGIGKTRLVAELARRVHREGALVLYGRSDEEFGVAYQPFVEALLPYVSGCPIEELRDQVGTDGADLARLLPVLSDRLALGGQGEDEDGPETGRYRMFEAINALLSRLSTVTPVLLVLDDLQWAAKPTLLLVRQLIRSAERRRLLVVGTFRDTDLDRTHPLAGMMADLRREQQVERLDLDGLDQTEVSEFVETAAGHSLDASIAAVAEAIYVETEGNPFFVGQLLRHLTESGALVQRNGVWATTRPLGDLGIPEGVRELIGRRLSRLSPAANTVMGAASVIGRQFDTALLEAVSGVAQDEVLDALEVAERARLIARVPGRLDRFTFVHTLVRTTLYDELPTTRRLRLHRRAGLELEARGVTGSESRLVELAHHFLEAAGLGEVERAVRYGRLAGNAARSGLAFEQAAGHYEGALGALELLDEPDRALRAGLKLALGDVLRRAGDGEFRSVVSEVVDEARSLGDGPLLAKATLGLVATGTRIPGPIDIWMVGLIEEALDGLGPDDLALRARLLGALAVELLADPAQQARRVQLSGEAVLAARRVGHRAVLARVLASVHLGSSRPENLDERMAYDAELVSLGDELGDAEACFYGHLDRFSDLVELGDIERADLDLVQAEALADQLRQPVFSWTIANVRAGRELLAGRVQSADRIDSNAIESGRRSGLTGYGLRSQSSSLRCLLRWEQGRLDEAAAIAEEMVLEAPGIPFWRAVLTMLVVEAGRPDDARLAYATLAAGVEQPHDTVWLAGTVAQAWTAASLGDGPQAGKLIAQLTPFAGRVAWNGVAVFGFVDLALGRLHATVGDLVAGEAFLLAAIEQIERIGAPIWLARTRALLAAILKQPTG
ncbi:MAG TPA: AAA family ATPase [Acidimicrobiales bacterium]|jgi:class 3 adenylate cyclase